MNDVSWYNSQIPSCTRPISHNAPFNWNRNVHISVLNGALWDIQHVHCRIWDRRIVGFVRLDSCPHSLNMWRAVGGSSTVLILGPVAPSQWETSLRSNVISHWRGTNPESALWYILVIYLSLSLSLSLYIYIYIYTYACIQGTNKTGKNDLFHYSYFLPYMLRLMCLNWD